MFPSYVVGEPGTLAQRAEYFFQSVLQLLDHKFRESDLTLNRHTRVIGSHGRIVHQDIPQVFGFCTDVVDQFNNCEVSLVWYYVPGESPIFMLSVDSYSDMFGRGRPYKVAFRFDLDDDPLTTWLTAASSRVSELIGHRLLGEADTIEWLPEGFMVLE